MSTLVATVIIHTHLQTLVAALSKRYSVGNIAQLRDALQQSINCRLLVVSFNPAHYLQTYLKTEIHQTLQHSRNAVSSRVSPWLCPRFYN